MHLGKFDILEEIGHGGFGTVYCANDTSLDRIVALKVLHKQYNSDQKFIESFKREARLMAKVSHPNVVQIFEVGDLDGQIYIAMQYFDGGSLEQKIQAGGPLPLKDAIRMLNQAARGLEAGHKVGLIHRDVKPANILYNTDDYIAISDFGVVKSILQGSPETTNSFNQFAGSPYYIPPELWQSSGNLSPAADVYSLACVLYEALTGEILFAGETYEHVLTRHVLEAPIFSKNLPENLAELLTVALAKNPSDRYQTMNDFLMATRSALENRKTRAKKTEPSTQIDVINELPKPLAHGEITFDQIVRQAQRRTAPESQAVKPVQQTPPPQPVTEPKQPSPEVPQKTIEPTSPTKKIAKPVAEVPKPSSTPPLLKSQTETSEVKHGSVNFIALADLRPANPENVIIPPVSTSIGSKNKDLLATIQQAYDQEPVQTSQIPGTKTPKKKKGLLPLIVSLGLISLLAGFLIFRSVILPPQSDQGTGSQAAKSQTPTTELNAPSYRKQDGMEMLYVPEGSFEMGSITGDEDEKPVRLVYLDTYWIDKYEVTNAQYAQCVSEGACTEPSSTSSYTRDSYFGDAAYDNYPVVHVTWFQAQDYCQWAGGDLPIEAQWEKAARGVDGRIYPWGDTNPDSTKANFNENSGDTMRAGQLERGNSPYGALDMAGNVWEWVLDWYGPFGVADTNNPLGPKTGEFKVFRGGSWKDNAWDLRTTSRYGYDPSSADYNTLGFRCVFPAENSQIGSTVTAEDNFAMTPSPTSVFSIGSTKFRELDDMEMVFVPEGSFEMGSATGINKENEIIIYVDEKPVHEVFLNAFYIDKFEVSNAQYKACVKAGKCDAPSDTSSDTRSSYYGNPSYAEYPVIHINWYNARDYCAWAGGRLPTEAEWEKAARGTDGRMYPWGNENPSCSLVNSFNEATSKRCFLDTKAVGSFPENASPYGALDMAGNVWEWVNDWYQEDYYSRSPVSNPSGPSSGDIKVLRGGSWYYDYGWDVLRTVYRGTSPVSNSSNDIGFRCVLPAP